MTYGVLKNNTLDATFGTLKEARYHYATLKTFGYGTSIIKFVEE